MKLFIRATLALFLAAGAASAIAAEPVESCGDILRYASRDVRQTVTFSDQRLYYYQNICTSNQTDFGLSFSDATSALGMNFSDKNSYCKAEETATKDLRYSRSDSSIVVRNSLDAYVACRALSKQGVVMSVAMPPVAAPTVFSITAQRNSAYPQFVNSLALDPEAVECSAQKDGQAMQKFDQKFNAVGFELPQSDAKWTLLCSRKAIVDGAGNKTYPPTQLILATSAGTQPMYLPQSSYAAGAWTSELRGEVAAQGTKLTTLEGQLAAQKLATVCGPVGYFPHAGAPACPANYKDGGQVTFSAPGGKGGYGGSCRVCLGS